ncbi:cysteine desulfurase [Synechococcus sp. HK05]|uniref:cysteine desulfurase family protein n=1 Tax=Synechococcus sp. HK05 TaxID=2725975 RepID=UPI001C386441|nr:cysteine desulfurase family protein [Synechococcus sp. HK05]MBV2350855.1 cysteine desulfurase [Synechococcus sp. HK05]
MPHQPLSHYLDCCATTPLAPEVAERMAMVQAEAWGNPSSLHGFGLAAAEQLERSRQGLAALLGCRSERLVFTSGGTESIHLALLGSAPALEAQVQAGVRPRLVISAVEHPATAAAAVAMQQRGWEVAAVPVDRVGAVDLEVLERLLAPPTRLVSLIWGQSEVGTLQPLHTIGTLCRAAGVLLHVDAVQVVGHLPVRVADLPVDLLSLAAHKLQGPRGIGALVVRDGVTLQPCQAGGGQEGGVRAGTEPVALIAGFEAALQLAADRLLAHGGVDPTAALRDRLVEALLERPGVELSGPDPLASDQQGRLPHHLSVLVRSRGGSWLNGRQLVQALWREGWACSSGSACSSSGSSASAVLLAMGYDPAAASAGLRISLGPWHGPALLERLPAALDRARATL